MTVYRLKSGFQDILRPLCGFLAQQGVTANQVTVTALALSVLYGAALCFQLRLLWILLPVFLFIRMALNAIDGMLAREYQMKSRLGMALNEIGDVIADTALLVPFAFYAPSSAGMVGLFICLAMLTEICGLVAFMMSGARRYDGPMGKSDRAAVTGLLGFLIGLNIPLQGTIAWIFAALSVFAVLTSTNRIKSALNQGI